MENIRIQDDLYTYVNQAKLEELVIPDDMPVAGGFATLSTDVEKLMIGEFNTMCAEASYPNDYMARACTLFRLARDVKRKKKHGIKPALKNLSILKKLGTMRSFNLHTKELILKGITMPINVAVEANMKDTVHHCVMIQGPSAILPDVSYYKNEQQRDQLLGLWSKKKTLGMLIFGILMAVLGLFGGLQALGILSGVPIFAFGIPAVLSLYFDFFSGFVQALVFSLLSMVYIAGACPPPEEAQA